ncbi:MAG TPA: hypothetical protein VGM87_13945 [Roseomonas sp.]|jgi:hypothetical protein
MALATYADLQESIAGWLNRRDLAARIPDFIRLAEDDINGKLRDRRMHRYVDALIGDQPVAQPEDWLEAVRLNIQGRHTPLTLTTMDRIQAMRGACRTPYEVIPADGGAVTGWPEYFAIAGTVIEFHPLPSAPVIIDMVYYQKVPRLSDAAPTNWLLAEDAAIYLYGSLAQAEPYLKNDERLATWAGLYGDRINGRNAASEVAQFSGGPLRRVRRGFR